MAAETVDPPILSSPDPLTDPQTPVVDHNSPSLDLQTAQTGPATTRRESRIAENDPSAYKITILLASSGYRTQISINRSFLEKASLVGGDGFLVGQLKNAIWKDWPSDWPDALPSSPNYLRLIYGGKMLADKSTLSDCNIGPGKPNIIHLSIRPADFVDDEYESGKKIPGIPRRSNGTGCCNCTVS